LNVVDKTTEKAKSTKLTTTNVGVLATNKNQSENASLSHVEQQFEENIQKVLKVVKDENIQENIKDNSVLTLNKTVSQSNTRTTCEQGVDTKDMVAENQNLTIVESTVAVNVENNSTTRKDVFYQCVDLSESERVKV